jgi:hypothetical protein
MKQDEIGQVHAETAQYLTATAGRNLYMEMGRHCGGPIQFTAVPIFYEYLDIADVNFTDAFSKIEVDFTILPNLLRYGVVLSCNELCV